MDCAATIKHVAPIDADRGFVQNAGKLWPDAAIGQRRPMAEHLEQIMCRLGRLKPWAIMPRAALAHHDAADHLVGCLAFTPDAIDKLVIVAEWKWQPVHCALETAKSLRSLP